MERMKKQTEIREEEETKEFGGLQGEEEQDPLLCPSLSYSLSILHIGENKYSGLLIDSCSNKVLWNGERVVTRYIDDSNNILHALGCFVRAINQLSTPDASSRIVLVGIKRPEDPSLLNSLLDDDLIEATRFLNDSIQSSRHLIEYREMD